MIRLSPFSSYAGVTIGKTEQKLFRHQVRPLRDGEGLEGVEKEAAFVASCVANVRNVSLAASISLYIRSRTRRRAVESPASPSNFLINCRRRSRLAVISACSDELAIRHTIPDRQK